MYHRLGALTSDLSCVLLDTLDEDLTSHIGFTIFEFFFLFLDQADDIPLIHILSRLHEECLRLLSREPSNRLELGAEFRVLAVERSDAIVDECFFLSQSVLFALEFLVFAIDFLFFFGESILELYRSLLAFADIDSGIIDLFSQIGSDQLGSRDDILRFGFCIDQDLVSCCSFFCSHEQK